MEIINLAPCAVLCSGSYLYHTTSLRLTHKKILKEEKLHTYRVIHRNLEPDRFNHIALKRPLY